MVDGVADVGEQVEAGFWTDGFGFEELIWCNDMTYDCA